MKLIAALILIFSTAFPLWSAQVFPAATNRWNTFFNSNTFNKNLYLTNVGIINTTESYSGTGTASVGAPRIFIGGNASSDDDSAINVGRNIQGTDLFSHAFRDESTFISTNTGAYCSYDSAPTISGTIPYNHMNGFQFRGVYNGTNKIDAIYGHTFQPTVNGPVNQVVGLLIQNPEGTGRITNFYGIMVQDLSNTNIIGTKYAFYSTSGSGNAYFGANLAVGTNINAVGITASGALKGATVEGSTYFISGGYILASANGLYNGNTLKDKISVGTAVSSGALPWIISSGDAANYTNAYISLNVDGLSQLIVTNTGIISRGTINSTNGFISEASGPFTILTNSTAPADTSTIRAWVTVTNQADGQVFKMPLYQ